MGRMIKPYEGFVSKAGMFVSLMALQNSYMAEAINSRNDITKYGLYQRTDAVSACIQYLETNPAEEVISKADYEARLKADMVAMLEDLRLDFQEAELAGVLDNKELIFADEADDLIQQKINSLKENSHDD